MTSVSRPGSNDPLAAIVGRLALAIALIVAIVLPLGYSILGYGNLGARVDVMAHIKADAITELVTTNPRLWSYQVHRLEELLAQEPMVLGAEANVRDAKDNILAKVGLLPERPVLRRSRTLYDSGTVVGRVEVEHSLRGLFYGTTIAAFLGLLLGVAVYTTLRVLPLRALRRVTGALEEEVRQHQLATERAEYLAYYDSLTTLPNRSMFMKLLNQAVSLARRDAKRLAVLFLDLDGFKNVNDTLGHGAGDLLLQEFGKRLRGCLRESDTVARLGGDEFVILMPVLSDPADVEVVARKVLAAAAKPFVALGQECRVTASVGISTYPDDGDDEQALMKNADIAVYQAKEDGKNNFRFYSAEMNAHSLERLSLESSLRRALEHDEFRLHYQPKVDAHSDAIVGIEALLRWKHPELGMVAPTKFIPIAEETGLIVSIGKWVLRTACAQNVAWQKSGLPHVNMAVNLSRRQFFDEHLLRDITSILNETGMSPRLLELEITESTLMRDLDQAMFTLKAFRDMGIRLAIDNFGTGYSSLSNLSRFPIDTIKVDGSFFRDLSDHAENRGVAEAVIAMGKSLSATVIAEGVETEAQVEFLREQACDEFQGFYFSKAVTAGQFAELLEAQTTSMPVAA